MMRALYILWYARLKQCQTVKKNLTVALVIIKLHLSEGITPAVSQSVENSIE